MEGESNFFDAYERHMTSHLIDRLAHERTDAASACIFCGIIARKQEAHIVAETDEYVAFLDTLPIRAGVCVAHDTADRRPPAHCTETARCTDQRYDGR